jgi:hypothetical protein
MVKKEELGYLGINVDTNVTPDWLDTEVINKAKNGDDMAMYRLYNFALHSDDARIRKMSQQAITAITGEKLGKAKAESSSTTTTTPSGSGH